MSRRTVGSITGGAVMGRLSVVDWAEVLSDYVVREPTYTGRSGSLLVWLLMLRDGLCSLPAKALSFWIGDDW